MKLEVLSQSPQQRTHPTPLLFVHGAWHGAWCWQNFLPYFAGHGYETHALSLRGHGRSEGWEGLRWHGVRGYIADLEQVIETDGPLAAPDHKLEVAQAIEDGVWGQGFAAPTFQGEFAVANQRVVGQRHLKLKLEREGFVLDAMLFFHDGQLPACISAAYQLGVNEYNGQQSVQLTLRHWNPA